MSTFYAKVNDAKLPMTATLKNADGTAINLTTATRVDVHVGRAGSITDIIINGVCTIVTAASGIVSYSFTAADLAHDADDYDMEFEVRWGDGTIITVPSNGNAVFKLGGEVG